MGNNVKKADLQNVKHLLQNHNSYNGYFKVSVWKKILLEIKNSVYVIIIITTIIDLIWKGEIYEKRDSSN